MPYDFEDFSSDLQSILKDKGVDGLSAVTEKLQMLLRNPEFVSATFNDAMGPGKRMLFHDPVSDARVQAHVHAAGKRGKPHSHGASWAIYGNARGCTLMTEWRRVNPESETHAVLEPQDHYSVGPGEARAYGPHKIHSTEHPELAWVIRVIGTDLNTLARYHFDPQSDSVLDAR